MSTSSIRPVHGGDGGTPAQQTTLSITSAAYEFKIEGYSKTRWAIGVGNSITSAVFTVGGHQWQLKYYPDGFSVSDTIRCISMALVLVDTDSTKVDVRATFSLLSSSGKPPVVCSVTTDATLAKNGALEVPLMPWRTFESSDCLKDDCFRFGCDIAIIKETPTMGSQFVAVPPPDLRQHYRSILSAGKAADVIFEVGGEKFPAHRCVLAARSPVFMAELFGPMKESTEACVHIHDMDARVFKAMLDFIYTDELPEIDDGDDDGQVMDMTHHLLVAADRYDLQRLKLICEHKLCDYINPNTAASMLTVCERHRCDGLRKACFKFLASVASLQETMVTHEFQRLKTVCPGILEQLVKNLPQ